MVPTDQPTSEQLANEQLAKGLARLHGVITALSGALSVAEVANVIMTQGVDALGADAGLVALLDEAASEIQVIDSRGYDPDILRLLPSIPLTQPSVLTEAVRTRSPFWISSIVQQLREFPGLLVLPLSAGFQARAALPLQIKAEIIGVLQLNFLHERPFDSVERTLLEALAAAGAQALDRARVYDQQQRSVRRLKTLRMIDQLVLAGQPSGLIAERALDDLHAIVPYQAGCVMLMPSDNSQPQVVASRDWSAPPALSIDPLQAANVLNESRLYTIADLNLVSQNTAQFDYLLAHHIRSLLSIPLYADGLRIGQIDLFSGEPAAFREEAQHIVLEIANQIAIVLRQEFLARERERAEERFAKAFNAGQTAMVMSTIAEGRIIDANPKFLQLFGCERSDVIGHTSILLDMWHDPADRERAIALLRQQGKVRDFELPIRVAQGAIRNVILSADLITTATEQCLLTTLYDITERKQAEQALHDREEYLRVLTETMPAVPWSAKTDGRIDYFTQRWLELTGMTHEQALHEDWQYIVHPDDKSATATAWQHSLATGTAYDIVHRIRTVDGTYRWQRSRALPQHAHDGRIMRWHGITDDIHELRMAEERVRESEARFRLLSEQLPQLVWTCAPDGLYDYLGPQWVAYTGVPQAEQLGKQWMNQLHPDDREPTAMAWQQAVETDSDFHVEFRIRRHDGVYRWFDTRAVPLKDASGQTVKWFGTNTDIEGNKRNQEMLQLYTSQLQRLSHQLVEAQEIERRNIAHELHDQVGQALTGLKLLFDSTSTLSSQHLPEQLAEARRAINELLERVRTLSLDLRPSMLDDLGLLPALKWLIDRYTAQTSVQVRWWHQHIDQRFSSIIETSVYRIVQEALTNVARHAHTDRVEVRLMADDEQFLIQIDDDGQGFDLEAALQSRQSVGLLGMRERVELLGGSFLLDSALGQGTHLNVSIPLCSNR